MSFRAVRHFDLSKANFKDFASVAQFIPCFYLQSTPKIAIEITDFSGKGKLRGGTDMLLLLPKLITDHSGCPLTFNWSTMTSKDEASSNESSQSSTLAMISCSTAKAKRDAHSSEKR